MIFGKSKIRLNNRTFYVHPVIENQTWSIIFHMKSDNWHFCFFKDWNIVAKGNIAHNEQCLQSYSIKILSFTEFSYSFKSCPRQIRQICSIWERVNHALWCFYLKPFKLKVSAVKDKQSWKITAWVWVQNIVGKDTSVGSEVDFEVRCCEFKHWLGPR